MDKQIKLALSCFQQGNLDKSLSILNSVLTQSKENAFAWFLSAIIQMQKNNIHDAINNFRNAINIQPNYPEALNNLGVALEANNQPIEAEKEYLEAVKQKKDYANAYYNLANIQKTKGEFDNATDNYLLAIKHKPDYANALNNLEDRKHKPPFSKNPPPCSVNSTPKNAENGRPSRLLDVFLSFVGQKRGRGAVLYLPPTAVFVEEAERGR